MPTLGPGYPGSGFWRGLPAWVKDERVTGKELLWIAHHRQDGSAGAGYSKTPCPRIQRRSSFLAAWAPLALDEYDFASLRQAGQAYVAQTAHIQRMPSRSSTPSWRVRTAAAYVPQVSRMPVVLLDMSLSAGHTAAQVHEALMHTMREQARRFGFVLRETPDTAPWVALSRLRSQREQAYGKFVVLVDEYDAALAEWLAPSVADAPARHAIQVSLRYFYRTLKTWKRAIHFVFITGILAIRGSGLFSTLNNPVNLSADPDYDASCGFTEAETQRFFRFSTSQAEFLFHFKIRRKAFDSRE